MYVNPEHSLPFFYLTKQTKESVSCPTYSLTLKIRGIKQGTKNKGFSTLSQNYVDLYFKRITCLLIIQSTVMTFHSAANCFPLMASLIYQYFLFTVAILQNLREEGQRKIGWEWKTWQLYDKQEHSRKKWCIVVLKLKILLFEKCQKYQEAY